MNFHPLCDEFRCHDGNTPWISLGCGCVVGTFILIIIVTVLISISMVKETDVATLNVEWFRLETYVFFYILIDFID